MSYHNEPAPQIPPLGYSPANPLIGTSGQGYGLVFGKKIPILFMSILL